MQSGSSYWAATAYNDGSYYAYCMYFYANELEINHEDYRFGQAVRLVCDEISDPATALQPVESIALYTENGRIVCEQEFQIFTITGQNVTEMNGSLNGVYIVKVGDKAQKVVVK